MDTPLLRSRRRGGGWRASALALALLVLTAGCASETGTTTDAAVDHSTTGDTAVDDLGSTRDAGADGSAMDATAMDSTVPRCVPGMTAACACVGGASGAQTCTSEGVYGACVCPDASAPTDAATDAWTLDVPVVPLGPRLITPQSISRTTTQRPTFRWVLPEGVTRARITVARNRALTMDVRTGMATGTSWRPTEALPFAVWFWRVEGLGDDGGVVWTSPTWEFRAPRRDTAVDSSWGTWRDFNGDGYDDLALSGADAVFYGDRTGLVPVRDSLRPFPPDSDGVGWSSSAYTRVSDLNGDGYSDLVYHMYWSRIYFNDAGAPADEQITRLAIYYGRVDGVNDRPDVVLDDFGSLGVAQYGSTSVGDFNGDGFGDVLASVQCRRGETCSLVGPPGVMVYSGSASGLISPPSFLMPFVDVSQSSYVSCSSDLDANGLRDFVLDFGVWSQSGDPRSSRRTIVSFDLRRDLAVESPQESMGCMFDLDIDGDGRVDWVRGVTDRVDVLRWTDRGLTPSGWPTISAPDTPSGIVGTVFGSRLAAGDVNGDGYADLVAGAPEAPLTSSSVNSRGTGSVYLFLGSPRGLLPMATTWRGRVLSSSSERDRFGDSISAGGDFDGDGFDDVAITAVGSNRVELRYGSIDAAALGVRTASVESISERTSSFSLAE